jgi:hypothetical protein
MSTVIKIVFLAVGVTYFLTRDGSSINDILAGVFIVILASYTLIKIDKLNKRE